MFAPAARKIGRVIEIWKSKIWAPRPLWILACARKLANSAFSERGEEQHLNIEKFEMENKTK